MGIFPFPGATAAATRATMEYTDGLAVNAASPNKDLAIKFVDFFAREGQARLFASYVYSISLTDYKHANIPVQAAPFKPFVKSGKTHGELQVRWSNPNVAIALGTSAQGLLTGQSTVDDVLKAADAAWG